MKLLNITAASMAAAFVLAGQAVFIHTATAQVQVVESGNRLLGASSSSASASTVVTPSGTTSSASNPMAEMFYQMQTLQQEVQELRGLVEEQAYQIKHLKQQRLDDYVNLDKRLSEMSVQAGGNGSAVSSAGKAGAANTQSTTAQPTSTSSNSSSQAPDEIQSYRTAIDLVLQKKDYDQAVIAFKQYLDNFPQGRYAANSQYWLGELYLLKGDLEQSRQWFTQMLEQYPNHSKVPDATYKLGTVYHKLGDQAKAKELLQSAAAGDSNAASLAKSYLDTQIN